MLTMINEHIEIEVAGENSLILYFSSKDLSLAKPSSVKSAVQPVSLSGVEPPSISTLKDTIAINDHVQQAVMLLRQNTSTEIIDLIPSYASILVIFNLLEISHNDLCNRLKEILRDCESTSTKAGKLVELPAYYSIEEGVDLKRIAKHANLSVAQVINLHQAQEYRVYAIGFAPGFAYLGDVDSRIAIPRLSTPRLNVPKGAIAIADRQTAVYPSESPGGWNIIGLCPIDMFDAKAIPSMPIEVGDRVKFVAIDKQQFLALGGQLSMSNVSQ